MGKVKPQAAQDHLDQLRCWYSFADASAEGRGLSEVLPSSVSPQRFLKLDSYRARQRAARIAASMRGKGNGRALVRALFAGAMVRSVAEAGPRDRAAHERRCLKVLLQLETAIEAAAAELARDVVVESARYDLRERLVELLPLVRTAARGGRTGARPQHRPTYGRDILVKRLRAIGVARDDAHFLAAHLIALPGPERSRR